MAHNIRDDFDPKPGSAMRVIGLAGWSGAGKTTLLRRLIPALTGQGLRVSTLKHAHHAFDIDQPGKDSWEHRQAGATEVLIGSAHRWALMRELRGEAEPGLPDLLARLSPVDLVIVEGFKRGPQPKIEVHREANGKPFLHPEDASIIAIATDAPEDLGVPKVHIDDMDGITALVLTHAMALP